MIELLVVIALIGILIALLLPAVQSARESSRRVACGNNLKQLGIATTVYETTLGCYPFGVGGSGPLGYIPRWSAQSQLLIDLDQTALFNAINFEFVPWLHNASLGQVNETALATTLAGFLCPSDSQGSPGSTLTAACGYRANAGTLPVNLVAGSPQGDGRNTGVFWFQSTLRSASIKDGTGQTALFSERCIARPGSADRLSNVFQIRPPVGNCSTIDPTTTPGGSSDVELPGHRWADGGIFYTRYHHILPPNSPSCNLSTDDYSGEAVVSASSRHPGGVNLLAADGSVRFVRQTVARNIWQAVGTVDGGETITASAW